MSDKIHPLDAIRALEEGSALKDRIEAIERERDEARGLVIEANNSLYGSQGYFHSLNGGPYDKYHLAKGIENLKSSCRTAEREVKELRAERDSAREYGKEARIRENKAEDARIHEQMLRHAAEADKARLSHALRPFADMADYLDSETEGFADTDEFDLLYEDHLFHHFKVADFRDARAALSGSGSGWRTMDSAPETGFFLAWSPDFPDMVSCWKAEIFHQARKPGTPRHLSANHFTLWRPLDLPAAPQQGGE